MVTSELINYIKSQLDAGISQEIISSTLLGQGWAVQDVKEGFNSIVGQPSFSVSLKTTSVMKKKWTIGRIILWLFIVGIIAGGGFVIFNAILGLVQ